MKRGVNLSGMRQEHPAWWRSWGTLLLLFLPPALAALFSRGPWGLDELRLLQVTREMASRGAWLVPTLLGETYTHKPPLLLWLNRILLEAGLDLWISSRILSIAAGAGTLLFFAALARRLSPQARKSPAAPLAATPFFLLMAQLGTYDMSLLFFLSAAAYTSIRNKRAWILPGIFTGLAVLTKGPVALLFLLAWIPALRWALWGGRALVPTRRILFFLLVALGIVAAWFLPFCLATAGRGSWTEALFRQSLGRVSGAQGFGHPRPFWYYIPLLPLLLLPWSWTLLRGLPPTPEGQEDPWKPWEWAVLLSGLATVFLFSCFKTKAPHYLLPLLPWFLLLLPRAQALLPPGEGRWLAWMGPPAGILLLLFGTGLLTPLLSLAGIDPGPALRPARLPALLGGTALLLLPLLGRRLPVEGHLALTWTLLFLAGLPLLDRFQLPYPLMKALAQDRPRRLVVVHSRYGGSLTFLAGKAGLPDSDPSAFSPGLRPFLLGLGARGVPAPILKGPDLTRERILLLQYLSRPGSAALLTKTYKRKLRLRDARLPVAARGFFRGEEILLLERKAKKKESAR